VVSPDYRLTPDVTITDQIADCVAAAEWLGANAASEFGSDRLLIGGISAGGHLAAATLLHLRAAGPGGCDPFGRTSALIAAVNGAIRRKPLGDANDFAAERYELSLDRRVPDSPGRFEHAGC
jgi:acetyl esterase/lipase